MIKLDNYYICEIPITTVHSHLFLLLKEFDRICRKHNIRYTLEGGTLLGADKYQDFVPWDDDIDIVMLRFEYERFKNVCKTDLSEQFFLQNTDSEPNFPLTYSKLRMNDTIYLQKTYDFLDIHQGVFLDIFPLDYTAKWDIKFRRPLIGLLNGGKNIKLSLIADPKRYHQYFATYKMLMYKIISLFPMKIINRLLQKTISLHIGSRYLYNFCNPMYNAPIYSSDRFNCYVELPFRGLSCMVIQDYRKWLNEVFGDYMSTEPDTATRGPSHAISACFLPYEKGNCNLYLSMNMKTFSDCISAFIIAELVQNYCLSKGVNGRILDSSKKTAGYLQIFKKTHLLIESNKYQESTQSVKIDLSKFLMESAPYLMSEKYIKRLGMKYNMINKKYTLVEYDCSYSLDEMFYDTFDGSCLVGLNMEKGEVQFEGRKYDIDLSNYFALIENAETVVTDSVMTAITSANCKVPFYFCSDHQLDNQETFPFEITYISANSRTPIINNRWEILSKRLEVEYISKKRELIKQIDSLVCSIK